MFYILHFLRSFIYSKLNFNYFLQKVQETCATQYANM